MIHANSLTRKVMEFVQEHPGTTRMDILRGVPGANPHSVSSSLTLLRNTGVLEKIGSVGRGAKWVPTELEVDPAYFDIACDILEDLKSVHHTARAVYLAKQLERMFG